MADKKTICLITDWYPTENNPYAGLFFKEQALLMEDVFDFKIVRYRPIHSIFRRLRPKCNLINTEKNTKEYSFDVSMPIVFFLYDFLHTMYVMSTRKGLIDGIGSYISPIRTKYIKKQLKRGFSDNIIGDFDYLYCVDAQREASTLYYVAELCGKPIILGEHAPVPWPGTLISDENKKAIEKADVFMAISNDKIRQLLLQNIKLPHIKYVGNLIDEDMFSLRTSGHEDVKTITIIAANSFYKNYNHFIDVMNRLSEIATRDYRVLIVGYGANKGYSKNVEKFEKNISTTKFYSKTTLIREVPHEELYKIYHQSDAFVMTSIQEGQPVSALEAACCGVPIFSTKCGGVEDYVDDNIGRIYELTDVESMAQGLNAFINDEISFDSNIIRKTIVDRFGKKAFYKNFVEAFTGI